MDTEELIRMLGSSAGSGQYKFIPWWDSDFDADRFRYRMFREEEIEAAEACIAGCSSGELSDTSGSGGMSLFHLLVWHNFYDAVRKVLDGAGIDVNMTDGLDRGLTPFLLACCRGNLAMAKLLLEHGADGTHCDAAGRNGYHYLAVPFMEGLQNGYECRKYSLSQREAVARLLGQGMNEKDENGLTPLALMLQGRRADCSYALTDVFLEKGAETDYVDERGNTLLLTAIHNGHMTAALRLAGCSGLINRANADGETPMQAADRMCNDGLCMALKDFGAEEDCRAVRTDTANLSRLTGNAFASVSDEDKDKLSMALYLLKKLISGLDPDDNDDMGHLAQIMHSALMNDDKCQVLDICRDAGIDFLAPIRSGGNVFCLRDKCLDSSYGVKVIRKFLEYGIDMNKAVAGGKTPAAVVASVPPKSMLSGRKKDDYFEKAAEFFSRESMEQPDNSGTAAIHWAVGNGHLEMLRVMINKGVDVNLTQVLPAEAGNTPLHVACIYGRGEIVRLLEASGADSTRQNVEGELPAHLAVMKKKLGGNLKPEERAEVLRELKTLDGARNDGKTPLMLLQYLDLNTVRELLPVFLEKGVNINASDKDGNTALYYALKYGSQEAACLLIKEGADYSHTNNRGESAVQVAAEKGYDAVLELMRV